MFNLLSRASALLFKGNMSAKSNAKLSEMTGGQLKYLNNKFLVVEDIGLNLDFADSELFIFEDGRKKCNHLEIFNNGPNECMIGFDTEFILMNFLDRSSFNFMIYPGKPFNYISLDGEADSMSFRTLSGKTAEIELIAW